MTGRRRTTPRSSRRLRRGIAALSAGLLASLTGDHAVSAGFDEPRTSLDGPSDRAEPAAGISMALRLELAEVRDADRDDDEREFVRFTFLGPIDEVLDEQRFLLIGRDPRDVERAEVLFRDEGDERRVLAGFRSGTDVSSFALAGVEIGAVADVSGEVNARSTVLLGDPEALPLSGPTVGPELLAVRVFRSLERADFVFDEALDERAAVDPRDFGFYTLTGRVARGDRVISVEDEVVTVSFDEADGDQVGEGVRYFVLAAAIGDRKGNGNPVQAHGGPTTLPDLIAVDPVETGSTRFDFVFDQPVTDAESRRFGMYTANGAAVRAEALSRPGPDTVRVAFPDVEEFPEELVMGAVLPGAVRSDDASDATNTVTAIPLSVEREDGDGPTLGPDLVTAEVDLATGQVILGFDERIDDDAPVRPEDLALITASGTLVAPRAVVESDDALVIATFDAPLLAGAIGITLPTGAVRDFVGNPNPLTTLPLAPPA